MRAPAAAMLLAALVGVACSNLTETPGGIGSLAILVPSPAEVEVGQTLQLRAVALNGDGDSVAAVVYWRALDTTLTVDSMTGLMTGRTVNADGRVVARAEDLFSNTVTFRVIPPADTLIRVSADTQTVAASATLSTELSVRVEGGSPRAPVSGRRVVYQVTLPAFANADDRTVEFENAALTITPTTSSTGSPFPAPKLRKRSGSTPPDSAVVEVNVYRPSGPAIPGSPLRFTVRFARP